VEGRTPYPGALAGQPDSTDFAGLAERRELFVALDVFPGTLIFHQIA
jgi:hypothetical protein